MSDLPHSSPVPKVPQHTVLTIVLLGCLLVGTLASFAFLSGARFDSVAKNYYVPQGYVKQVLGMLEVPPSEETGAGQKGPLRHQPFVADPINPMPRWGQLFFDDSMASPRQRDFFQLSGRLRHDMDAFNESGDGFFQQQSDDSVWVSPTYHKFALPYPSVRKSHIQITMGEGAKPSVVAEGLELRFDPVAKEAPPLLAKPLALSFEKWGMGKKNKNHDSASAYELQGPQGQLILRFLLWGDQVKLQLVDNIATRIYLNGDQINIRSGKHALAFLARKDDNAEDNAAPLLDGDRLRIYLRKEEREIALRYGLYSGNMASRSWIEDGKRVTLVDPELARVMPFVADLHTAFNRYVADHPDPSQIGQPTVKLTFDRKLHQEISDIFLPYVRSFDHNRSPLQNIQLEPACVCVMNALTGEVLAMPSYPAPADVDSLRKRMESRSIDGLNKAKLTKLALNQNLALIPIGSTTKPLLALAIWDQCPNLRTLVVNESRSERSAIFDYKLARYFNTVPRGMVTPESFLRVSSNDYTVHLGMLMLAGPNVQLARDGTKLLPNGHLELSHIIQGDTISGGLDRPDLTAFQKLRECFDVRLATNFQSKIGEDWDAGPLSSVFGEMHADGELLYRCFADVLPQRTNLRLDSIASVRYELISLLLGSGNNYWSNVMLTQAYSRLGTGHKVNARFAVDAKNAPKLTDTPKLPLDKTVVDMVHKGMRSTAEGADGSTATRISSGIRNAQSKFAKRGLKLIALCKTGTASRLGSVRDAAGNIIAPPRECAAFCLYIEVRDAKDNILAAVTSSTYLQDRGVTRGNTDPRNSGVAVEVSNDFLPKLIGWLEAQPGVIDVVATR
ncbi:MAG: hypothetical protein ACOYOF_06745 [Verrucomicrobiaceae bacterium]